MSKIGLTDKGYKAVKSLLALITYTPNKLIDMARKVGERQPPRPRP